MKIFPTLQISLNIPFSLLNDSEVNLKPLKIYNIRVFNLDSRTPYRAVHFKWILVSSSRCSFMPVFVDTEIPSDKQRYISRAAYCMPVCRRRTLIEFSPCKCFCVYSLKHDCIATVWSIVYEQSTVYCCTHARLHRFSPNTVFNEILTVDDSSWKSTSQRNKQQCLLMHIPLS